MIIVMLAALIAWGFLLGIGVLFGSAVVAGGVVSEIEERRR